MKKVILVNYTGRRGGGLLDAFEMTRALIDQGIPTIALVSKQAENREEWKKLKLEALVEIDTYSNAFEFVLSSLFFFFRQGRQIKKELSGYDIVEMYCPMVCVWNPLINVLFRRVHKALVIHDPELHEGERVKFLGLSMQYGLYDTIIVHSKKYVEPMQNKYHKPTYYIPLGRHNLYKSCDNKKKLMEYNSECINFLFFGRISKYKGLDILAKAYRQLGKMDKGLKTTLTIVGNGNFEPYRDMYDELPNTTVINRWISDEEVESVFTGDNIVCVCPYREASQSGVVFVAMDYGVAIIASDSGAIDEQIDDGKDGLLFKAGGVEELAERMYRVAIDDALRDSLGVNASARIENCTWESSAKELTKVLELHKKLGKIRSGNNQNSF